MCILLQESSLFAFRLHAAFNLTGNYVSPLEFTVRMLFLNSVICFLELLSLVT
jgi:hypothetical protein